MNEPNGPQPLSQSTFFAINLVPLGAALALTTGAIIALMVSNSWVWPLLLAILFGLVWISAILLHWTPDRRKQLVETLRHETFTQVYQRIMGPILSRLWSGVRGERVEVGEANQTAAPFWKQALSVRLLDISLFIAVVYPALLLILFWFWGVEGRLGGEVILAKAPGWSAVHTWFIMVMVLILAAKIMESQANKITRQWLSLLAALAPVGAFTVVIFSALALQQFGFDLSETHPLIYYLAFAFAFAFAVAGAVAGAVAFAFAFAGAFADAFAGVLVLAVILILPVLYFDRQGKSALGRLLIFLYFLGFWSLTASLLRQLEISDFNSTIFLFFGVLPLINALFDFVSYGMTLTLSRWAFARRGLGVIGVGLLDLLIASVLFLLLGLALTCVAAGFNFLSGQTLFDLSALFVELQDSTNIFAYGWLIAMVFSTIAPTAAHILISLLAIQGVIWRSWREPLANWVAKTPHDPVMCVMAPLTVAVTWLLPLIALGLIVWGFWLSLGFLVTGFLKGYLGVLTSLAQALGVAG